MREKFKEKYGKSEEEQISNILITHVGKPISNFINFLEANYSRYCVPTHVASGLANLPVEYIWLDQKVTSTKTTMVLPTGEKLSGKKTYEMILPYYTTTSEYTAKNIQDIGEKQLKYLYGQAIQMAMSMTGKSKHNAVIEFKQFLDDDKHFFNTTVIPDDENGEEGGKKCKDMESAKLNCPVRYEAIQNWFRFAEMVLAKIEPKIYDMFHMTGEKATTPNCPLEMRGNFNPSIGSQSFRYSGMNCSRPAYYNIPFFLKRPGPKYNAFSVAGHEGRPGHHTQVIN